MSFSCTINIQPGLKPNIPKTKIKQWVKLALGKAKQRVEISVEVVDEACMAELNGKYRNKSGPTNVLSFVHQVHEYMDLDVLGDIVICWPIVLQEAKRHGKVLEAHFAHLIIHGSLHLQGYTHDLADEAKIMEGLEINYLQGLGFANPYQ